MAAAQAYRVESVDARVSGAGAPTYRVTLSAVYYGPDEDGPVKGQVLYLKPPREHEPPADPED